MTKNRTTLTLEEICNKKRGKTERKKRGKTKRLKGKKGKTNRQMGGSW